MYVCMYVIIKYLLFRITQIALKNYLLYKNNNNSNYINYKYKRKSFYIQIILLIIIILKLELKTKMYICIVIIIIIMFVNKLLWICGGWGCGESVYEVGGGGGRVWWVGGIGLGWNVLCKCKIMENLKEENIHRVIQATLLSLCSFLLYFLSV